MHRLGPVVEDLTDIALDKGPEEAAERAPWQRVLHVVDDAGTEGGFLECVGVAPDAIRAAKLDIHETAGRVPFVNPGQPAKGNSVETQGVSDARALLQLDRRRRQNSESQPGWSDPLQVLGAGEEIEYGAAMEWQSEFAVEAARGQGLIISRIQGCPRRITVRLKRMSGEWKNNLRVVMVATRNPLNIGAAARAMANFGFSRLRAVNPYDVAFREARSAVGAAPLLATAEECGSVAQAVADTQLVVGTTSVGHRELQHSIRRLEYGGRLIRRRLETGSVALLFGSEKFGLSNEDLSHCHWLMRIPTVGQDLSMNLGQAVALCLYELARDPKAAVVRPERIKPASAGDIEQVTRMLMEALQKSGYINPLTAGTTEEKVRRLVVRLRISARDAPVLMGMLRQILWKVGRTDQ